MDIRSRLWIPLSVLAVLSLFVIAAADRGPATLQVVYESDTRGYFLPCG
jgi:hypothetical protein